MQVLWCKNFRGGKFLRRENSLSGYFLFPESVEYWYWGITARKPLLGLDSYVPQSLRGIVEYARKGPTWDENDAQPLQIWAIVRAALERRPSEEPAEKSADDENS